MTLAEEIAQLQADFADNPKELALRIRQAKFIYAQDNSDWWRNNLEHGNAYKAYYALPKVITEQAVMLYLNHLRQTGQHQFAQALAAKPWQEIRTIFPFRNWFNRQQGLDLDAYLQENLSPAAWQQYINLKKESEKGS